MKWDARVIVLDEYDVKEERGEIFVKARAVRGLDFVAMRDELQARKKKALMEALMEALTAAA